MILTDTHSHLYDTQAFGEDISEVVERALGNNVKNILLPAIDSVSHEAMFGLCRRYPKVFFPMMGLHPTSVNDNPLLRSELDVVRHYLASPPEGIDRFYAVGEVGMDLYWSRDYEREQAEVFREQIELSLRYSLPLVMHVRECWPQVLAILKEYNGTRIKGVLHAYSGTYDNYMEAKEYGDFMVGIGGVVTYKKSTLPDVVRCISIDDIVLETDSPYLSPAPFRGKRNESGFITYICDKVAEVKGMEPALVAELTTANARRMFRLPHNTHE